MVNMDNEAFVHWVKGFNYESYLIPIVGLAQDDAFEYVNEFWRIKSPKMCVLAQITRTHAIHKKAGTLTEDMAVSWLKCVYQNLHEFYTLMNFISCGVDPAAEMERAESDVEKGKINEGDYMSFALKLKSCYERAEAFKKRR